MRPGGGKGKGSAYERKIAKQLSLWITGGVSKTELVRSVLSGGWTPTQDGEPWRQVGDLMPNGPAGARFQRLWAIECKHHRTIDIGYALWRADGGVVAKWWRKLSREIATRGAPHQQGLLIFRANLQREMVAVPYPGGVPIVRIKQLIVPWHGFTLLSLDDMLKAKPDLFLATDPAGT